MHHSNQGINWSDYEICDLLGNPIETKYFQAKVVLVVNVASQCGFTNQYQDLEFLHQKYLSQGLIILPFPCNQFGNQEPGDAKEILSFCNLNYGLTFPVMSKIDVNGSKQHPLWRDLKDRKAGWAGSRFIKWNFTKFLINRQGLVIGRFAPFTKPIQLENWIQKALNGSQD